MLNLPSAIPKTGAEDMNCSGPTDVNRFGWAIKEIQNARYPSCLRVSGPGWTAEDYNLHDHPRTSSVLHKTASPYFSVFLGASHPEIPATRLLAVQEQLLVVYSGELRMTKHLYDISVPKHQLEIIFYWGEIASPLIFCKSEIYSPGMKQSQNFEWFYAFVPVYALQHLLATATSWCVFLDRKSRSASPVPEWYIKQQGPLSIKASSQLSRLPLTKPPHAFGSTVKVEFSDIDLNRHLSLGNVLQFCENTIYQASYKVQLSGISRDDIRYVSCLAFAALQECYHHDELRVYVWKETRPPITMDAADSFAIGCIIQKDGKDAYRVVFAYRKSVADF